MTEELAPATLSNLQTGLAETANSLSGTLEALLLMATEPISVIELAGATGVPVQMVEIELAGLQEFYDSTKRGFELRRIGAGWRYYTRAEYAEIIGRWVLEGQQGKLSQAALETLAVVAYLQPISRGRVSAVRGVNVDSVIRNLANRELIEEVGQDPDTGAHLFATTALFLEKLGLTSLDELPPIAPYLPDASELDLELTQAHELTAENLAPTDNYPTQSPALVDSEAATAPEIETDHAE